MSADHPADGDSAAAAARYRALTRMLTAERIGTTRSAAVEGDGDTEEAESARFEAAPRPGARPPRRKYRGWTLASRRPR